MRIPDIIFAMPRYHYHSYTDFWSLVELSQFETCYVEEVDVRRHAVYIFTPHNGEWNPHINNQIQCHHNAHLIHWNLERPSGSGGIGNYARSSRDNIYKRLVDDVWVSDRRMSLETGLHYVTLGSDYGLGEPGDTKVYDFCHMSYIVNRRKSVYDMFDQKIIGPNCWPPMRDQVLKQSRFALNIHQDQYPFQEPLRFALFAAYGLPILTEEITDAYPWNDDVMVFNPYNGIEGRLNQMLGNDYTRWKDMGLRARDYMCDTFNFKKMVIQGVKESLSV